MNDNTEDQAAAMLPDHERTAMKFCKKCGSDSRIYDSRINADGSVVRRRKCYQCGRKWTTIEIDYWEYKELLKKTGDQNAELL